VYGERSAAQRFSTLPHCRLQQRAHDHRPIRQPSDGTRDVFVHASAVERAGLATLSEGQKINFDVVSDRGKLAADNLQAA
jgi:cold shock protein